MKNGIAKRIVLLAVLATVFGSWGFFVHRTVAQLAVYQLPKKMKRFFYRHMDSVVQQSVRPDQRRSIDSTEAPKHFIDLEMYGDDAAWKMPRHWEDAVRRYGKDSLVRFGYLPYVIIDMKEKLTDAFSRKNADSILYYAAYLGHYIGDAHVPLHVSANFDGQLTNQKGLHSLWETIVPQQDLGKYDLYDHHEAKYVKDPYAAVWTMIREAQQLLPGVFQEEKNISVHIPDSVKYKTQTRNGRQFRSYSPSFATEYGARLGETIRHQLAATAASVSDFWYTCWVDAGRPDLDDLMQKGWTKNDKKSLKEACVAYRHNQLMQKKMLMSVQLQAVYEQ